MADSYLLSGGESDGRRVPISVEPFTDIELTVDDDVIDWVVRTTDQLAEYYGTYRNLWRENIKVYTGEVFDGSDSRLFQGVGNKPGGKLNVIQPIVESHLSRMTGIRAHVSVVPVHGNDYQDLAAAKTAQKVIEMSFSDRQMSKKIEHAVRTVLICGCAYMLVEWNNSIGPAIPEEQAILPAIDLETGEIMLDEKGEPRLIRDDIRLGDVDYKVIPPYKVLEQPSQWSSDPDWMIYTEWEDVYKLRERYPLLANQIEPGSFHPAMSNSDLAWQFRDSENQVLVFRMYHRATLSVPQGRQIVCTRDVVLENRDLPYPRLNQYGLLPLIRLDDTMIPGYDLPLPMTVMQAGKNYQDLFNNINRNILRNMSLTTPKWLVDYSSGVRTSHLNNMTNIVRYRGGPQMRPELHSPSSVPQEYFNFRDTIRGEMQMSTGSNNAFNNPPPNTRAGTMQQHQEEQEFKRVEPIVRNINDFQALASKIAISIMADYYSAEDGRILKLMGGKTAGAYLNFQVADLVGPFDVLYERTSALPESKQGRLDEAARLFQTGMIDRAQYKKVIGFATDPELDTAESKAYEKQLLENELMLRGEQVSPPQEWEDHVSSLEALYPLLQSVEFTEMPEGIKAGVINHILATEMLAWKRAQISLNFALRLNKLTQYPVLFTALPGAMPVATDNPISPLEPILEERLRTPGLTKPSEGIAPDPDAPENV